MRAAFAAAFLKSGSAEGGIQVTEAGGCYVINNGTYVFRLRKFNGGFDRQMPLKDCPHWIAGMRSLGQNEDDGHAFFESNAPVIGA